MNIHCNCLHLYKKKNCKLVEIAVRNFIHFVHKQEIETLNKYINFFEKYSNNILKNIKLEVMYEMYFHDTNEYVGEIDILNIREIMRLFKSYKIVYINFSNK